ncbi:helix-turn-helix domain-containing protein [Enterococcus avium]
MRLAINQTFKQSLSEIGINYCEIVKKAGLTRLIWEDSPILTHNEYFDLFDVLDSSVTDKQLLLFSDVRRLKMFVPPIFATMCALNGREGINRLSKYKSLIGPVSVSINMETDFTFINFSFENGERTIPRFCVLNEQLLLVNLLRNCTGENIQPKALYCEFEYSEELIDYLGCPTSLSSNNVMVFDNEALRIPFKTQNNVMWGHLVSSFDNELKSRSKTSSFIKVLEKNLLNAIPSGRFSLQEISDVLGKSSRSIQRSLAVENTTFREEVKKVQLVIASDYLRNTDLSIEELAYLLGYENTSSFHRAFKKWTGRTVSEYRLN